jgi:NDP-sugar pyrophosphorylase family protein
MNGDILTDIDYRALFAHHLEQRVELTVTTCRRTNLIDYGVIETTEAGLIADFREKPEFECTVSAGVYVFDRRVLRHVPVDTKFGFDDLMATLLAQKYPIATYPHQGYWLDIGRLEDYDRAQRDLSRIHGLLGQ